MKGRFLFLILLIPYLSKSQNNNLGFNVDLGLNIPIFNQAPLRLTYNASTAVFYKINKQNAFSFIPEIYVEKTSNRFKVTPDYTFVNDLYRVGFNIGTSIMLNKNWSLITNLYLSYLFYNSIFTVYQGINSTSTGRTSNSDLSNNVNKFIPGLALSFCYSVSKRFGISINYKQALLPSYSNNKFFVYDTSQDSINFNNKESKLTVSFNFYLKGK
jgi:hypothetical protein